MFRWGDKRHIHVIIIILYFNTIKSGTSVPFTVVYIIIIIIIIIIILLIIIIIIIMTSFAPISSKIKLSGATKPRD